MKLPNWVERLPLRLVLLVPIGALLAYAGIQTALRPAPPDPRSQLGVVEIDLQRLDYRLKFDDLQSAGMFTGIDCGDCDFSAGGSTPGDLVGDYTDPGFTGFVYLTGRNHLLQLTFYGRDIPAGQQRLDQALHALGARFPDRADAIRVIARGFADNARLRRDR